MEFETLKYEIKDKIAIITINRPKKYNALNSTVMGELLTALEDFEKSSAKVAIITGEGEKAFAAGADLNEFYKKTESEIMQVLENGKNALIKIESINKPVIAAVNGLALGGGCELALACDIRIASENAKFGLPEMNLGIFPGWGGIQRLVWSISLSQAKELVFTGDMIDAKTAESWGLVNKVVPSADLMNEAMKLAEKIASKSSAALAAAKDSFRRAILNMKNAIDKDQQEFAKLFNGPDPEEGISAFFEKRKPSFQ